MRPHALSQIKRPAVHPATGRRPRLSLQPVLEDEDAIPTTPGSEDEAKWKQVAHQGTDNAPWHQLSRRGRGRAADGSDDEHQRRHPWPHVSEKNHDLTAGQLLTQHNHAAWRPTKWNEFLPMSMPIVVAVLSLALLSMARAPRAWLRPQSAGTSTAGPSHQRTCRSSTMWSRRQRH
jgi:hypothetical protein